MKNLVICCLLCCSYLVTFSQQLSVRNSFWGYGFKYGKENISFNDTKKLLTDRGMTANLSTLSKAKGNQVFSNLFGIAGGGMVGWELGNLLSGEKINGGIMGGGIAGIIVSYVFSSSAKKGFDQIATDYNKSSDTGYLIEPSKNGFGLVIKF